MSALTRRDFLAASGGLVVTFKLGPFAARAQGGGDLPRILSSYSDLDSWLGIGADGSVTVFTGKVELGQGIKTALVQIAAEELDVAPDAIELITADTARTPDERYTAGSRSVEDSGMAIRHAAAQARRLLLEAASERLGAPIEAIETRDGRVFADGQSLGYGELLEGRALSGRVSGTAPLKQPDSYRIVGQSLPRVDLPDKVFGGPAFIQDLRLEGMVHARMVHPPGQRARLASVETSRAEAMPGVLSVLQDGSLLGVVAEREEQAVAAASRLREEAAWNAEPLGPPADEAALEGYLRGFEAEENVLAAHGAAPPASGERLRASYLRPFQAHASIGPSCAVAEMRDGRLTVWTHSQGIYPLREEMTRVLGVAAETIHMIYLENAGCYGQNGADDAAMEAALLARAIPGRPVRLQWSREDEFGWEPLGTAMLMDCEAVLSSEGKIADWRFVTRGFPHPNRPGFGGGSGANLLAAQLIADGLPPRRSSSAGLGRNAVPLYDFPSLRVEEHFIPESPVRVSSLRALGAYANVFALESFMDEMAAAAGADPVEFRLAHLSDTRGRAVIEAAAQAAAWERRDRLPTGRGLGVAFARYNNGSTYCAAVAEAEVTSSGAVRVHRLWLAADCGQIINPDGVRNQIAGGAIQSTSWTLKEGVRFAERAFAGVDWQAYPILAFSEAPEVEVVLVERPDQPPLGTGEASQGPTAAAIANAVYAASGARVRQLPLSPRRVTAAR